MVFIIFSHFLGTATSIFHSAEANEIYLLAPLPGMHTNTQGQASRERADLWHPGWALVFGSDVVHWFVGVAVVLRLCRLLSAVSRLEGADVSDLGVHRVPLLLPLLLRLGHKRSVRATRPAGEVVHGSIAHVFPAAAAAAAGVQPVRLPPLLVSLHLADGPRVPSGRRAGTRPQFVRLLAVQHRQGFALAVQQAQFRVDSLWRGRVLAVRPPLARSLGRRQPPLFVLQDLFLTLVRRPLGSFLP